MIYTTEARDAGLCGLWKRCGEYSRSVKESTSMKEIIPTDDFGVFCDKRDMARANKPDGCADV